VAGEDYTLLEVQVGGAQQVAGIAAAVMEAAAPGLGKAAAVEQVVAGREKQEGVAAAATEE
jgi:hypothetical protein